MIRDIIVFPDKRIHVITADLREFDEALVELIDDMKDTMNKHNIDALSANQLAIHKPVILLRDENGEFLEIINPRELKKKDKFLSTESTLYYPDIQTDVMRYRYIKIVYQDRFGKQQFLTLEGDRGVILQRKIDYCFGATLANRINPKVRETFERQIGIKNQCIDDVCPTAPLKRDFIKAFMSKVLFLQFLTLFAKLFNFSSDTISTFYSFDKYSFIVMLLLLVLYAIVGYKESKIYSNCSTCNLSYVVMTAVQYLGMSIVLYIGSRFFLL